MTRAALLIAMLFLAGCASDGAIHHEPATLPDLDTLPMHGEVIWDVDTGDGAGDQVTGFQLAIDGRNVYVANRDGVVTALKIKTGEEVWSRDTGLRLISGPTYIDDKLLLGTRDGAVVALSAKDGKQLWLTRVSSVVLSAPAAGSGTVVVRTLDGNLMALRLSDGELLWTVSRTVPTLTLRGTASPVIVGDAVYAGMDNGKLLALDLSNGEQRWQTAIAVPSGRSELERIVDLDAPLLVLGPQIFVASAGGQVAAVSRATGRIRWNQEVAVRTGITFDRNQVFITDMVGGVWSFDRVTGAVLWHQEALAYRQLSAPVMYRGYVMIGDYEGYLHWLVPEDGSVIGRVDAVDGPIRATPVVVGDRVLVLGVDGTVAAVTARQSDSE